ncbi:MAG: hypothetical protein COU47_02610 [Candidatus Niyogibacteria bacterium CG10_big_fil_rev_8_21_14_0_10_46_36]|uniref:Uncharacterized protein n=1 Tax=Candidatus Niyogibacteria bacterium CG10_big_fil_rev_8_21_14_0_10_46_36 TaxID=1974726 RepID=A0A2H0TD11_9BACT|nr:MAG: hypothetical protein COU47_02610 [Candidatus Niyogibacteria bacterium CG10_big_fil_rev_8_21_14_0_10_46_36]
MRVQALTIEKALRIHREQMGEKLKDAFCEPHFRKSCVRCMCYPIYPSAFNAIIISAATFLALTAIYLFFEIRIG